MAVYKRGATYWYKFKFAGRVFRESAQTKNRGIAIKAERQRHSALEKAANGIVKRTAPVKFSVAAAEWFTAKEPTWAPKTVQYHRRNLAHLTPHFGGLLTIDIRADDISEHQKRRLKAGVSPKSVNHEVGTLRAVLVRSRLWAALQPDVTTLRVDAEVGKALTKDEEVRLLEECASSRSRTLLPFVQIALHTGLRKGEIQSLRWDQIDFLSREITVGRAKTVAGTGRVVPLNARALATLQAWAMNFQGRQPHHAVFPSEAYGFAGDQRKPHSETVDPTVPLGDVKTAWQSAKRAAGIKCRFHDCRHTACTRLLERGASLSVVSAVMGWSASTTAAMAKRYGHIGAEAQRAALDTLVEPRPAPRWSDASSF